MYNFRYYFSFENFKFVYICFGLYLIKCWIRSVLSLQRCLMFIRKTQKCVKNQLIALPLLLSLLFNIGLVTILLKRVSMSLSFASLRTVFFFEFNRLSFLSKPTKQFLYLTRPTYQLFFFFLFECVGNSITDVRDE